MNKPFFYCSIWNRPFWWEQWWPPWIFQSLPLRCFLKYPVKCRHSYDWLQPHGRIGRRTPPHLTHMNTKYDLSLLLLLFSLSLQIHNFAVTLTCWYAATLATSWWHRCELYTLFFLESGESTSMIPASDPAMAAATVLGESKVLGPAGKTWRYHSWMFYHNMGVHWVLFWCPVVVVFLVLKSNLLLF